MCVCVPGPAWPIRLALPTCLFSCYHDSAHHARPTPYGCHGNIHVFFGWCWGTRCICQLVTTGGWWEWACVCVAPVLEQINWKHWASRRQNKLEKKEPSAVFFFFPKDWYLEASIHHLQNSPWVGYLYSWQFLQESSNFGFGLGLYQLLFCQFSILKLGLEWPVWVVVH